MHTYIINSSFGKILVHNMYSEDECFWKEIFYLFFDKTFSNYFNFLLFQLLSKNIGFIASYVSFINNYNIDCKRSSRYHLLCDVHFLKIWIYTLYSTYSILWILNELSTILFIIHNFFHIYIIWMYNIFLLWNATYCVKGNINLKFINALFIFYCVFKYLVSEIRM